MIPSSDFLYDFLDNFIFVADCFFHYIVVPD